MKKIVVFATALLMFAMIGCNNDNKVEPSNDANLEAQSDSLFEQVMDGHDIGMAKERKLETMTKRAEGLVDSLAKLPAKAMAAAEPFKQQVSMLLGELKNADSLMTGWMNEFDAKKAKNAAFPERIDYLKLEKIKIDKVKDAILNSLNKADTLLKP